MDSSLGLFLAILGIIIIFRQNLRHHQQIQHLECLHSCKAPPTEIRFKYDFFGILKALELAFHFHRRTSLIYTNALFKQYGETYLSNILTYRLVFTHNAENIKHILSTAFPDFDSSPLRRPLFEDITPHGIFTLDGAGWKKSRERLRSRMVNLRQIIDLDQCEEHFQDFLQYIPPNGGMFDVQACAFGLSLDMQTLFSLGESVNALSFTQSDEKKQFFDDLLFVKERIVQDGFRGPLRYLSPKRRFLQCCARAREFVMARTGDEEDANQALSILLANDSMSTTLSGLFFCLAQDERVVHKLRASIIDTVGLTPPTWGQLGSLHYVRWVLQEVMRLYPAVVLNARVANKNTTLPTGGGDGTFPILVQKGDIILFSTWARHRLGHDFGENPDLFYPERWEKFSADTPGYIPFNKGPRSCPGQHYAMIVLTYIVARIFQTFSKVSNFNTKEWTERISMTFENQNGVLIGLS
ncbi:hypothetical protein ASPWEDRAFT_168246 [Aspergillus wentii DTO 134E9]|uniref:Cytochrome P450 n=1 Tax=Aspergillus wentii DTO 134E9 TaxID=1073089 RepID=A0A1L9RTX8_ASPWE|nr:uncharacterized protein ASPWEDRAFT_168246 [Aspergillus wentii DTO 134E9]KAI9933969.1 hypothetical protein MW887_005041 [Aspergillus wentii]OJJ38333.1 hypothetical protein ASPWEDRAFT_168246 [Aspergillus wentii DTO 134E9]